MILEIARSKMTYFLFALTWLALWFLPWGKTLPVPENLYLAFLTDMIRLGIAIGMFIIPGILLYILLRKGEQVHDRAGLIPIGFALSVMIIAVIGLVGRLAGFPFILVRNIFALFGTVELIIVILFKSDLSLGGGNYPESIRNMLRNEPLLFALILAAVLTLHEDLFFIDDLTYSAYLTSWQHSEQLGFENIIHQENVTENVRFWLAMYPMGQALLSDVSGVPGLLLIGNYLEPLLTPIAVLVSYWFARVIGLSRKASGVAVLLQISLYTWMIGPEWPVGKWFYDCLSEDKVSVVFFLAPVFFVMVLRFLQEPTGNNRLLILLTGFGITLTHPIMLFFSCSIAALLGFFAWISKRSGPRQVLEILIICIGLMIPYAVIRLSDRTGEISGPYDGAQASTTYQIERYTNIVSDIFYGLNPEVLMFLDFIPETNAYSPLEFIRVLPMILVAFGILVSVRRRRQGPLYWYVLASGLLVFFAALPYTGWILGYFVSARMISRVAWFFPIGLAGVLVLQSARNLFKDRVVRREDLKPEHERKRILLALFLCFIFVSPFLVLSISQRLPLYFARLVQNKQLAEMGNFVDNRSMVPTTSIALNYRDNQLLPSVSADANLISFREELDYNGHNNFLSLEQVHERISASTAIRSLDQNILPEEKCALMDQYQVRFVLARVQDVELFNKTLGPCAAAVQTVHQTKDLVLLEVR